VDNDKTQDAPKRPGISLLPSMTEGKPVNHQSLWWCHAGNRAIRMGDWKLAAAAVKQEQVGNRKSYKPREDRSGKWELYNLREDRSETNDLAGKHPEIVAAMNKRWEEIAEDFRKHLSTD
jgi:arylsulfatase